MYNSVVFSILKHCANHRLYQVPKHFITLKENHVPIKQLLFIFPSSQSLATTNQLSVSTDSSTLDIS